MKYFPKLAEGEPIQRMKCVTTYLSFGFRIYRYAGESGPSVRVWWGDWKSKRRFLWGQAATPSYEGELLAAEIMLAPPAPWPPADLSHPYEAEPYTITDN